MSRIDPALLTLRGAADLLRTRELSAIELTRAVLDRVDRLNPSLNAYITVMQEQAMADALIAEEEIRKGRYHGPLHGIPVGLKDLLWTKGVRTTAGSKILANFVPEKDATAVRRLREAGAVIVGKLNMHEFAWGGSNINPHYGVARNPWNLAYIPGGSSGGSGVAIAASLCLGSLGSDTLGSIRIPAAACGIVGLKPTYGRVSRYGAVPLAWSMDHVGPMTRTVEDAAIILKVIAGYDRHDPASADRRVDDYTADLGRPLNGTRLGLIRDYALTRVDPEVEGLVRAALKEITSMGAEIVEVTVPSIQYARAAGRLISMVEASTYHKTTYGEQRELYGPDVRVLLDGGSVVLASDYLQAQRVRRVLGDEMHKALAKVDAFVMPTLPGLPSKIEEGEPRSDLARFTGPFNLTGLPTISLPCGFGKNGLPVGLSFAGRPFGEQRLLAIAHQYEQHTPWHKSRPNLEA